MPDEPTIEPSEETPAPEGLGDAGRRALDAERKARRDAEAARKALEDRLAELESAGKSELEKALDRIAAAEKDRDAATASLARLDVALAKAPQGLSIDQIRKFAGRLSGATREELEADAADLFADLGVAAASGRKAPAENLKPGDDGDADPPVDADAIAREILDSGLVH